MMNPSRPSAPTVWVLTDDRPGNTTQSVGLADALGWPYQLKPLRFNAFSRLHNRFLGANILGLTKPSAATIQPPWPDIVIASGRRTAPVSRWIKQSSLGLTQLVHLGRKGGDVPDHFDVVITPSYCRLPSHPRRIETIGPLTKITPEKLLDAARQWPNLLGNSRHPRIVLLVGGATHRHCWNVTIAHRLGQEVQAFAKKVEGSVHAVTSRRTGDDAVESLKKGLGEKAMVDSWRPNRKDNPYLAYLALADVLIVTGDSESMLAEAMATDHPVCIYALPEKPQTLSLRLGDRIAREYEHQGKWAWLMRNGIIRPPRDLHQYYNRVIQLGRAHPFGAAFDITPHTPLLETPAVARQVKELLGRGEIRREV